MCKNMIDVRDQDTRVVSVHCVSSSHRPVIPLDATTSLSRIDEIDQTCHLGSSDEESDKRKVECPPDESLPNVL